MRISVKIITLILVFSMVFSVFALPADAALITVGGTAITLGQVLLGAAGAGVAFGGSYSLSRWLSELLLDNIDLSCVTGEHSWVIGDVLHHGTTSEIIYECSKCGVRYSFSDDDFVDAYNEYVSSLVISSDSFSRVDLPSFPVDSSYPCFIVVFLSGNITCITSQSSWVFSDPIYIKNSTHGYKSYILDSSGWVFSSHSSGDILLSTNMIFYCCSNDIYIDGELFLKGVSSDGFSIVNDSASSFDSRFYSITRTFNEYNTTNNYIDDSTAVNFYLSDIGADNYNSSNLYNINLYDEETMVFTEPVSGQQYQSTGWTYDYNDRSYDITLESGTFTLNDTDITEVIVAYMDDYAAITYLDASGNAVHTVKYAYVAVSQSECSLNGHTNTVETLSEPTCIRAGERKYTCSVCGNEEIETIPELGHIWKYSVLREPADGNVGLGLYECQTCGTNYTEEISAGTGDNFVDLDPDDESDSDKDYYIKFEDADGNEQETSIFTILGKFDVFKDIYDIGDTLFSAVTADAAAAYALNDGGELSSQDDGAPSIVVNLGDAESKYGYEYGGQVEVLDLSWYAPYKERVDNIVSGFLWLLFLWGLFKTAPGILSGIGITENRLSDISDGSKRRF